jgi:hypothetical protein
MDKLCVKCKQPIHPLRLKVLPNTTKCVSCSDVQKKGVVTVMKGEGDHTWIETIHLEHEDYKAYIEAENKIRKNKTKLLDNLED